MTGMLQRLPLAWALGLSLFRGRGGGRVSVATVVSVAGIAVGVATLTAVLAVTGGFEAAFRDRILGVHPHMVVLSRGDPFREYPDVAARLARIPGVAGTNPSTYDEMMLSGDGGSAGVILKGVDLEGAERVSRLRDLVRGGSLEPLRPVPGRPPTLLVGCALAERLSLRNGDRVTLTTPIRGLEGGGAGPLGMAPQQGTFFVADCLDSGFWEYDSRLVLMEVSQAQAFLGRGPVVRWVELRLEDIGRTEELRQEVLAILQPHTLFDVVRTIARLRQDMERLVGGPIASGASLSLFRFVQQVHEVQQSLLFSDLPLGPPQRYRVIDWREMNRNLFGALRTQKVVLALFFLIIVLVAAFNIVGTQWIVGRERQREVSTLVALGASRGQLQRVFVAHGFSLGLAGVGLGLALGRLVVHGIGLLDFSLDPKVYLISRLPATLTWTDALVVSGTSLVVVLVSCIFSSWRATRVNPVVGLRRIG